MVRESNSRSTNRRVVLKTLGAGGIAGLAGCIGGQDGGSDGGGGETSPTPTPGDSEGTPTPSDSNGETTGTPSNGDWPDLSGEEVHFMTDASSEPAKNFWNTVRDEFKQATGANIKMEYVGIGGSSAQRLSQLLQAGDPPEVFTANGGNVASLYNAGVLAPVDDALESATEQVGAPDDGARIVADDKNWLVPMWTNHANYFYRDDLVDQYGPDNPPETWADMVEFAQLVDENTDLQGTYIPAASDPNQQSVHTLSWFFPTGVDFMKREGGQIKLNYDSGKAKDTYVQVLNHAKELHSLGPSASDSTYTTWSNSLPAGSVGTVMYPGFRPIVKSNRRSQPFASNVRNIPGVPSPDGSGDNVAEATTEGLVTFKQANVEAASVFMDFLLQPEMIMDIYFDLTPVHNVPAFEQIRNGDTYTSRLEALPEEFGGTWRMESIKNYQEPPGGIITRANDISPPNPYVGASYQNQHVANIMTRVLINDEDPATVIDDVAPQHAKSLQEAQQ